MLSKSGIECEKYLELLKAADPDKLESDLSTEIKRQVFWLKFLMQIYSFYFVRNQNSISIVTPFSAITVWIAGYNISIHPI